MYKSHDGSVRLMWEAAVLIYDVLKRVSPRRHCEIKTLYPFYVNVSFGPMVFIRKQPPHYYLIISFHRKFAFALITKIYALQENDNLEVSLISNVICYSLSSFVERP